MLFLIAVVIIVNIAVVAEVTTMSIVIVMQMRMNMDFICVDGQVSLFVNGSCKRVCLQCAVDMLQAIGVDSVNSSCACHTLPLCAATQERSRVVRDLWCWCRYLEAHAPDSFMLSSVQSESKTF